ncbi:MAG: Ig-like domain-containing protein [Opitutaceae bacterium]
MKPCTLWAGGRLARTLFSTLSAIALVWAASAQISGVALTNRVNGISGRVEGSVHQNLDNGITLNGGAIFTEDLLVAGTPSVVLNGKPAYGGTIDGGGAVTPQGYSVMLNGGSTLRHVVRRTNPVALMAVGAPTLPTGTRSVTVNSAGQTVGSWATLRNLTLNGGAGQYSVPAGVYGDFAASSNSGFVLGVAGASTPAEYAFQRLTLNGQASLRVVGPVRIHVGSAIFSNGPIGNLEHPEWLELKIQSGGLVLNSTAWIAGYVFAPRSEVIINSNTQLIGGLECDALRVNGGGVLRLRQKNLPPVAQSQTIETDEDAAVSIGLAATDPEGQPLAFSLLTQPTLGVLSGTAPNLTFTPVADRSGTASFTYKVSDGQLESGVATITIKIRPINDCPVSAAEPVRTAEDNAVPLTLTAFDAEGDPLVYAVMVLPKHGVLTGTAPALTYTPNANYHGADSFSYTVNDGACTTAECVVPISIEPVNDVPEAFPLSAVTDEDVPVAIVPTGSDTEGDSLHFTIVQGPAYGTLTGSETGWIYVPAPDYHGSDSFTFIASDGVADSAPAPVRLTIRSINDAPEARSLTATTDEEVPVVCALSGVDSDGDPLTFRIIVEPAHGRLEGTAPALTYSPDGDFNGEDTITYVANDGIADSSKATVRIVVRPVNDCPVPAVEAVRTAEDSAVPVVLSAFDVEGDTLSYAITRQPEHGVLSGVAPELTYTPSADYHGTDSFGYMVSDRDCTTPAMVVPITIDSVNDAPTAVDLAVETDEDVAVDVSPSGRDSDGDALSYRVVAGPVHGTLSGAAPALTYTPVTCSPWLEGFQG